jgi:hypothetical protein
LAIQDWGFRIGDRDPTDRRRDVPESTKGELTVVLALQLGEFASELPTRPEQLEDQRSRSPRGDATLLSFFL